MSIVNEANGLIDASRKKAKHDRAVAVREYAALLDNQNAAKPGDAVKLIKLADELGISMEIVTTHGNAVASVQQAKTEILKEDDSARFSKEVDAAHKAFADAEKEWEHRIAQLRAKNADVTMVWSNATNQSQRAEDTIARLQKSYPIAFGVEAEELTAG